MLDEQSDDPELNNEQSPQDAHLEELVAYLDGELPPATAFSLEQKLAGDIALRKSADSLDRTWKMLGAMDEASAGGDFVSRTLDSIHVLESATTAPAGITLTIQKFCSDLHPATVLLWLAAGFIGTASGLLLARASESDRQQSSEIEILNNLDLLQNYKNMRPVPDLQFLKEVQQATLSQPSEQSP
ncbi:MAG: hypothetical protein ACPGXX_06000 [Planctomycetaceae bacterium]